MSMLGTKCETKVRLSQDICGFRGKRGEREKRQSQVSGKGTESEAKVRFSHDICGFNLKALK
jgi:hypothetical protein